MAGETRVPSPEPLSISFSPRGVILHGQAASGGFKGGEPVPRGAIGGFSAAARRRFRETLWRYGPRPGWSVCAMTLTIPGPILTEAETRRLWKNFKERVHKRGWAVVWRREQQKRGAAHWHILLCSPDRDPVAHCVVAWWGAVGTLGEVEWTTRKGDRVWATSRMGLSGAMDHAAQGQTEADGRRAWLRYMADHASKQKRDQETTSGRSWGVINRRLLVDQAGEPERLEPGAYLLVRRALQRLSRPGVACPRAPFGRKLGFPNRRGDWGASVWFSEAATVRRLVAWARAECEARGGMWANREGMHPAERGGRRRGKGTRREVARAARELELRVRCDGTKQAEFPL